MNAEDSLWAELLMREYSKRVGEDGPPGDIDSRFTELEEYCLWHAAELAPTAFMRSARQSRARFQQRKSHDKRVHRAICKRYAKAFNCFEQMLASAENSNASLRDAWRCWYETKDKKKRSSPIVGFPGTFGGMSLKCLLLMGMHARMIVTATEILHLLRAGFPEGAFSRARTMHELAIKIFLITIDKEKGGYELAERYYLSSSEEFRRLSSGPLTEKEELVRAEVKRRFGGNFFESEHNWAAPIVKNSTKKG